MKRRHLQTVRLAIYSLRVNNARAYGFRLHYPSVAPAFSRHAKSRTPDDECDLQTHINVELRT